MLLVRTWCTFVIPDGSLNCFLPDLAAFLVGCILWNIIPDDPETIVRYSADQGALEMGQINQTDPEMPSVGYRSSGKAHHEQEDEDVKAISASTRVEPVA